MALTAKLAPEFQAHSSRDRSDLSYDRMPAQKNARFWLGGSMPPNQLTTQLCIKFTSVILLALTLWIAFAASASAAGASAATTGRYINLPGVKLWYLDTGQGTPVVFIHANTGTSTSWKKQIDAFSSAGYRVITFDRRGWGKSIADKSSGAQPGSVAGDLDALATLLNLPPFHLIGVAAGGFATLDYASWRPNRLRSIVIAASNGHFISESAMKQLRIEIAVPSFESLSPEDREIGVSYRTAHPDGVKEWSEIERSAHLSGSPMQDLHSPNTFAKMEAINVPALVIAGDEDLLAPPALMHLWASHLKQYELANIRGAGHSLPWERPEEFNETVLTFLGKH
ncbi:pimeloyl-ACP methyl ester carboxylesterase [Paraburkholderia sp. BL27I4N3]|uniref:alpha/beta fold hydrolase n=1 Tax=Paraburkholderia sp. BL27I4N3 TaxID=1938805 RepID=UPI000E264C19|nr:alpha/beta hydrolase [Paraburkholderia sp. BL27I4N3]REE07450.1 pimeloyl-ACP methyl ester carboxylesterase [Paraburkholderia sp. BL27I4N3]